MVIHVLRIKILLSFSTDFNQKLASIVISDTSKGLSLIEPMGKLSKFVAEGVKKAILGYLGIRIILKL